MLGPLSRRTVTLVATVLALEEVLRIDPENDRARLDLERIRATT